MVTELDGEVFKANRPGSCLSCLPERPWIRLGSPPKRAPRFEPIRESLLDRWLVKLNEGRAPSGA